MPRSLRQARSPQLGHPVQLGRLSLHLIQMLEISSACAGLLELSVLGYLIHADLLWLPKLPGLQAVVRRF